MVKGDVRHAWNKGKTGIYSEYTRHRIGLAKRKKKSRVHKQKISAAMKRIRQCSACSTKSSKWIYKVLIPTVSNYELLLCDTDLVEQFHSPSEEDKKKVVILQ